MGGCGLNDDLFTAIQIMNNTNNFDLFIKMVKIIKNHKGYHLTNMIKQPY